LEGKKRKSFFISIEICTDKSGKNILFKNSLTYIVNVLFEEDVKASFVGRDDSSLALAILESGLKELDGDIRMS